MDYEQEYKDALERAKDVPTMAFRNEEEVLTYIFPELRESEDEKIREFLYEFIKICAWSEKQYPPREKCLAYLEKQKENPKSVDSIPLDCVSDVKCRDRWHKVGDSLPDNPREVLCKDEAGNYFIGRCYGGEGWEISNYDDEDKPHHLNPPVSKWIDLPPEKQKEPKPTETSNIDLDTKVNDWVGYTLNDNAQSYSRKDVQIMLDNCARYFYDYAVMCLDKPAEWSEELDIYTLRDWTMRFSPDIRAEIEATAYHFYNLRPHWKPSEEQMDALFLVSGVGAPKHRETLKSLYNGLKKLM